MFFAGGGVVDVPPRDASPTQGWGKSDGELYYESADKQYKFFVKNFTTNVSTVLYGVSKRSEDGISWGSASIVCPGWLVPT